MPQHTADARECADARSHSRVRVGASGSVSACGWKIVSASESSGSGGAVCTSYGYGADSWALPV
eukprot:scaffold1085_cov407-Prasinococcus_capsulatus_cf.AAC.92